MSKTDSGAIESFQNFSSIFLQKCHCVAASERNFFWHKISTDLGSSFLIIWFTNSKNMYWFLITLLIWFEKKLFMFYFFGKKRLAKTAKMTTLLFLFLMYSDVSNSFKVKTWYSISYQSFYYFAKIDLIVFNNSNINLFADFDY